MKLLITLLFLSSLSTFAQEIEIASMPENITQGERAVVAVTDANIVYRGIENKINIAVAGIDPSKVTVAAPGIFRSVGQSGEYSWNVTDVTGNRVKLSIVYKFPDGHSKVEQKEFEIRHLKPLRSVINGHGDYNCIVEQTSEQLKDAQISVVSDDMVDDLRDIQVRRFEIHCDKAVYTVEGNKIINTVYEELKKLKSGSVFHIRRIEFVSKLPIDFTSDIKVMIIESKP